MVKQKNLGYIDILEGNEKYVIKDEKSGSHALVPIRIDEGCKAEVVQIDKGLIINLPKEKHICDSLVFTLEDMSEHLNITWLIELKGTKNLKEAQHAVKQITETIEYLQDQVAYPQAEKYLKNRDYVFVAVAGAPDKTLPVLNNDDIKSLCRKLKALSVKRKNVENMFAMFCYIRPNRNCKVSRIQNSIPPYAIECYTNNDGYISYPSMLTKILKGEK